MWPLAASNSRLLRLRLEEAAIPPPPGAVAVIEVLPGKRPAAEAMLLLVDAGIVAQLPYLILDDVDEHSGFDLRWRIGINLTSISHKIDRMVWVIT